MMPSLEDLTWGTSFEIVWLLWLPLLCRHLKIWWKLRQHIIPLEDVLFNVVHFPSWIRKAACSSLFVLAFICICGNLTVRIGIACLNLRSVSTSGTWELPKPTTTSWPQSHSSSNDNPLSFSYLGIVLVTRDLGSLFCDVAPGPALHKQYYRF